MKAFEALALDKLRLRSGEELEVHGRHATFVVSHVFDCAPGELWPWLTEPERIACWSLARVAMHGSFGEGAVRTVQIRVGPLRVSELTELVTRVEPERSFAYSGCSIEKHRGLAVLRAEGERTKLVWTAEFEAPLRGLARPMATYVRWQMERSFHDLATLLSA